LHIDNERGGEATGFIVPREYGENRVRVFLVTNKHVIGVNKETRSDVKSITVDLNMMLKEGRIEARRVKVVLDERIAGKKLIREHPEHDVDVVAIDLTHMIVQFPEIEKKLVDYGVFATKERLNDLDVAQGDDVMIIGYPQGVRHKGTAYPLVRSGIIASRIGERLEDSIRDPRGSRRNRTLRGFLVDGGITPGFSGSPVVLKPIVGRIVKRNISLNPPPPLLLGVIAETRYAPIHVSDEAGDTLGFAGLALAFDAETIKETVELFFQ